MLGTPEDHFWNTHPEPFGGLLAHDVDDGVGLGGSSETGPFWALPPNGGFQAATSIPDLSTTDSRHPEHELNRYPATSTLYQKPDHFDSCCHRSAKISDSRLAAYESISLQELRKVV